MATEPLSAIIVGAGHRAMVYASYARHHPDELRIVGVADPQEYRRRQVAELYQLPPERCFASAEELAAKGRLADAVINGTMDAQHVPTTLPLLAAGYDVLLEKPFAVSADEVRQLAAMVRQHQRKVLICHVLRYAPFYRKIREQVAAGLIGTLLNLQTSEHVSYHHMSVGFVRGKWNRQDRGGSSMLMAKCCHDLDLLMWFKSGVAPRRVSSFGGRMFFRPECAPHDAGTQCLVDCPLESRCTYSARKLYLDHTARWAFYVWDQLEDRGATTLAEKEAFLRQPGNPYGRCIWKCDNDVVDHQSVMIEFADGATATHNLVGGTSRPCRTVHLLGTTGEILGCLEDEEITVRHPDPRPGREYKEERLKLGDLGDTTGAFGGHGGGDLGLVSDFVRFLRGGAPSLSCTTLDDSLYGHLVGFAADQARREGTIVPIS